MGVIAVNLPDAHLSWSTWADYPDLNRDSFCSFSQAVDHCLRERCDLILPGDVIDRSVQDDGVVVAFLSGQMLRLRDRGLSCWFTVGQHDRTRRVPWLSSLSFPNVIHANELRFRPTGSGLTFYGLDFQPAGQLAGALARVPAGVDVLVCHQVWHELMHYEGRAEGSLKQIPHARMVLTGDYHAHKVLKVTGASGQEVTVVSSGSTHLRSLAESPVKYFHVINEDLSFESRQLKTRPFYVTRVVTEQQLQSLLTDLARLPEVKDVPAEIAKWIVHLEYDPTLKDVGKRACDALAGRAFLFDRPLQPSRSSDEEQPVDQDRGETIDRGLAGCLEFELSPWSLAYQTGLRLLATKPQQLDAEVARIVEELMSASEESVL